MNKKKVYFDVVLNIAASGLPIAVLQLMIYPLLSRQLDADTYGLLIALYSLVILINDSLGKSINNIRLVRNNEEVEKRGDYNIVLVIFIGIGILITAGGLIFYSRQGSISFLQSAMWIVTAVLYVLGAYLIVFFRIRLNFFAIFMNAIFVSAGTIAGYAVYRITGNWASIFLMAHVFEFIYLLKATNLLSEPFRKTELFKPIMTDCSLLAVSMFLAQGMIQADKLLLLPMLGGEVLAIYYTASLPGKVVSLAMGPINSVILSYIAGRDSLTKTQFKRYFSLCFIACAAISITMLVLSRPILGFLFPNYVAGAMHIIVYTTVNVFLYTLAGLMTPIVMKYCDIYWQIVINGVGALLYISFAIVFLKLFGVIGFCVGIGISHFIRLIMMMWIYKRKKDNN